MTLYIKNLVEKTVEIKGLRLGIHKGKTRKIIADFDKEYVGAKCELDILIDDNQIELIDNLGHQILTSEVFETSIINKSLSIASEEIKTEETETERFYYVEDMFCISKGGTTIKSFKGYADTFSISVKNKSVKYRIKSQGVAMPWQYLKVNKENILNFEYRLKDPIIEILSDAGDASLNIYIDGFVKGVSSVDLQNFIDTWYENQTGCSTNEWDGETEWWNINKITETGAWSEWDWTEKVGVFTNKTIIDYDLGVGTKIGQQSDGAKLTIPMNYNTLDGNTHLDFKIFENEMGTYTIELVAFNDIMSWNPKLFMVQVKNLRYIEFADQTFDMETFEMLSWDDRWTDIEYYANTGMKFISENAGFKSALGSYTVDLNGKPKIVTLMIDDQNLLTEGQAITSLAENEYDFFIIANGADSVTMDSVITFDNSGGYPLLKVDGELVDHPTFFSDPALNYDGKDHFIYENDGNGGTNILIEDLPGLGDEDFDDIVLNVNFPMTDKIIIHTPTTIDETLLLSGCNSFLAIETKSSGKVLYSMGMIEIDDNPCQIWRLRNGDKTDLNVKFSVHKSKTDNYYTVPAKTDMYLVTPYTKDAKMKWIENGKEKYSKKKLTFNIFKKDINLKNEVAKTITVIDKTTYEA